MKINYLSKIRFIYVEILILKKNNKIMTTKNCKNVVFKDLKL